MPGDDWMAMSVGGTGESSRGKIPFCLALHGHIHRGLKAEGMTTETHAVPVILAEHSRRFHPVLNGEAPCPIADACTLSTKVCERGQTQIWNANRQLDLFGGSTPVIPKKK